MRDEDIIKIANETDQITKGKKFKFNWTSALVTSIIVIALCIILVMR